jgi:hypothetical protein
MVASAVRTLSALASMRVSKYASSSIAARLVHPVSRAIISANISGSVLRVFMMCLFIAVKVQKAIQ